MRNIKELQSLPEFQFISTFEGVHPVTKEPCQLAKVNQDQMRVIATPDMAEFIDADGSQMRVVNTVNGLMKMKV